MPDPQWDLLQQSLRAHNANGSETDVATSVVVEAGVLVRTLCVSTPLVSRVQAHLKSLAVTTQPFFLVATGEQLCMRRSRSALTAVVVVIVSWVSATASARLLRDRSDTSDACYYCAPALTRSRQATYPVTGPSCPG